MDALKKIGSTIKKETTDFAVEHGTYSYFGRWRLKTSCIPGYVVEKGVKLVAKGVDFVNPVTHIPIVGDKFKVCSLLLLASFHVQVGNVVDKTITDAKK